MQKAVLREAASQKHTLKRTNYSSSGLPSSKFAKPQDIDNNLFQRTRETDTSLFSQGIPLTIFPTFLLVSISHLISAGFLASNLRKSHKSRCTFTTINSPASQYPCPALGSCVAILLALPPLIPFSNSVSSDKAK